MKILSVELVGYKRFQLNQVMSFKMTLTELVQLILGTNGSGKSSLIAELTPLPADPSSYFKEGSKTITIMHRGHTYVLKSWFSPSQKHSFEKDSEPLNPGETVTVQKELVRQEFGITPDVHELLIGKLRFSQMSPIERRKWFTRLSDTNYDYALAVFQKLKDRLRDTSGAQKLAKKRLVTEQSKMISAAEQEKLTRETHEIGRELHLLQAVRAPVERPSHEYAEEVEHGLHTLGRLSQQVLRARQVVMPVRSMEELEQAMVQFRQDAAVQQELINKAVAEHSKVEETIAVLKRTGAEGVASLLQRRGELREQGDRLMAARLLKLSQEEAYNANPGMARQALESLREQLAAIFTELPENQDRRYSSQLLGVVQQNILATKDQRSKLVHQQGQLGGRRQHMQVHKNADQVQCPACMHRWHLGYSESEAQALESQIEQLNEQIKTQDELVQDLELKAKEIHDYGELYRTYVRITQGFTVLQPLWNHIAESEYVTRAPRMVPRLVEEYLHDLGLEVQVAELARQIQDVDALIKDAEQVGDASLTEQQLRLENLNLHIEELTHRLNRARESLSEYSGLRTRVLGMQTLGKQIEELQASLDHSQRQQVEMLRRETLHSLIRTLQIQLGRKEDALTAATHQQGIVAHLEASIAEMEVQEEAARMLVQELSPTQGLIAEGLMGFIRTFTAQMNNLIRKIWTYPLVIQNCGQAGEDGAELDYKFPMMVNSPDNVVKDVSEGSTGQQEVIDVAFKVTSMAFLGLVESPLYLDEFGAHFDDAHRSAASAVIKALMEQRPFTQLFMVSHYEANHGAHTNAEVCVIDANNITVPGEYNRHVQMS